MIGTRLRLQICDPNFNLPSVALFITVATLARFRFLRRRLLFGTWFNDKATYLACMQIMHFKFLVFWTWSLLNWRVLLIDGNNSDIFLILTFVFEGRFLLWTPLLWSHIRHRLSNYVVLWWLTIAHFNITFLARVLALVSHLANLESWGGLETLTHLNCFVRACRRQVLRD